MNVNLKRIGFIFSFITMVIISVVFAQNEMAYAKERTVTYGGVVYKVLSDKDYTAEVISASKDVESVQIDSSIVMVCGNVDYGSYQVTKIAQNAFKNRSKIKSITLPATINSIGKNAFSGINKNAKFTVPYGYAYSMKKLIMNKKVGWKNSMQLVQTRIGSREKKIGRYHYSIKPLAKNVCDYFYVKTDNPDPDSFVIVDDNTKLTGGTAIIRKCDDIFADVKYTNKKKYRVNGGYIFQGYDVDGGNLKVMAKTENYYETKYTYVNKKVSCPKLTSMEQYLINTYTNESMSFFEKMPAVQEGLDRICLYSGAYILGDLKKRIRL